LEIVDKVLYVLSLLRLDVDDNQVGVESSVELLEKVDEVKVRLELLHE
jgi:hypothetical protein